MNKAIRFKLFVMMVLEFFIWGAWFPLIFGYLPSLGFSADRADLDSQRLPDRRHRRHVLQQSVRGPEFCGGAVPVGQPSDRRPRDDARSRGPETFWPFFAAMLVHCLLYVPTISITNSIAFAHMKDRAEGVRHRPHGRHDRVDSGGVAVHVHPRGLGPRSSRRSPKGSSSWLGHGARRPG